MKPDWLWMEFSNLHARWMSGKISKEEREKNWQEMLAKAGITAEEFSAKHGGAN